MGKKKIHLHHPQAPLTALTTRPGLQNPESRVLRRMKGGERSLTALLVVLASLREAAHLVDGFSLGGNALSTRISSSAIHKGFTSSFTPMQSRPWKGLATSRKATQSSGLSTQLSMVVDRLSDTCIEATKAAMKLGHQLGVSEVRNELLFAGIVTHPERARRTLDEFGMLDILEAELAAKQVLREKQISTGVPSGNDQDPLPFGADAKETLNRACEIADDLESPTVRSEHVLLALMGYNDGKPITNIPIGDTLKAVPTIKKKRQFSVTVFCNELIQTLPLLATDDGPSKGRVVVTRGDTGTGSTLKEVGVDWTQLALEGKLDPVYGREAEIMSALRTLGRRRKNNPVLLGDPGVGKVSYPFVIAYHASLFQTHLLYRRPLLKELHLSWPKVCGRFKRPRKAQSPCRVWVNSWGVRAPKTRQGIRARTMPCLNCRLVRQRWLVLDSLALRLLHLLRGLVRVVLWKKRLKSSSKKQRKAMSFYLLMKSTI